MHPTKLSASRSVGLCAVVCLLLALPSISAAASPIRWTPCSTAHGFQCARMKVPLDYRHPLGPTIRLALIRHRASDPGRHAQSLLFNPGGPGGPGTYGLPLLYSNFPAAVRAHFDIVSFDPRGIGQSDPLKCFTTASRERALAAQLPAGEIPVGPSQTRLEIRAWAELDRACARNGGPIQYHMGTADVARDMNRIRTALGQSKLDYYGISYGTYLGAVYANLFPSRVGRFVLDGNVPPVQWNNRAAGRSLNTFVRIGSPHGTQTALRMMLRQCGTTGPASCAFSAGSPSATTAKYRGLLSRLRTTPITVNGQTIDYGLALALGQAGLETQNPSALGSTGWRVYAKLLQALWTASRPPSADANAPLAWPAPLQPSLKPGALLGSPASPPAAPTGFNTQLPEGVAGVLCSDSPNPHNPDSYARQTRFSDRTQSPAGFGALWTWTAEVCAKWRATDTADYHGPWNRSPAPILTIGTRGDPDTPYGGTRRMAAELRDARILTEAGGGHTALANPSACVNRAVGRYLLKGTLPTRGTVCQQNSPPC